MDKSRVCVSRTINLAKEACVKKQNLLVYEKKTGENLAEEKPAHFVPRMPCMPGKKIRVCTGAELKKMCAVKPCACPRKKPPLTPFQILCNFLGFTFKAAVAGAVVYWTYDKGVWGSPDGTEAIYTSFCQKVQPGLCPNSMKRKAYPKTKLCEAQEDLQCSQIPPPPESCTTTASADESLNSLKEAWNKMVVLTFDLLVHFPTRMKSLGKSVQEKVSEMMESDSDDCEKKKDKKKKK